MKRNIDPIDVAIGRELHDIRKQRGFTMQEVADRLRCTKALISMYESGKTAVSVPQLVKLCAIYQVDYTEVLEKVKSFIYGKKETPDEV